MLRQTPHEVQAGEIQGQRLLRLAGELEQVHCSLVKQLADNDCSLSSLKREYNALQNTSALINRLPPELLCLVFSYCLDEPRFAESNYYTYEGKGSLPEVTVSHVCQHWRGVALSFPHLWSTFRYQTPKQKWPQTDRFTAYLTRSHPVCMDLYVYITTEAHEDMRVLDMAAQHIHRWRRATILPKGIKVDGLKLCSPLQDKAAPNLEYFYFHHPVMCVTRHTNNGDLSPVDRLEPMIFKLGAPKLAYIHLDSTVPYFFFPPMENVRTLCLNAMYIGPSSITWSAFLSILALPSLTSLSIGGNVLLPPTAGQARQPIQVQSLKHLRWSTDPTGLDNFLSYLDAPNLETLVLCRIELPDKPARPTASLPALRSLHIIECSWLEEGYIAFLAPACPGVTHLSMSYDQPRDGHLLGFLVDEYKQHGRTHWEGLEQVTCYLRGVDAAEYLEFARPRAGDGEKRLVLRVSRWSLKSWQEQLPDGFAELGELCALETWNNMSDISSGRWPPGDDVLSTFQTKRYSLFNFNAY
ncbi:hypothetical protein FA15DRAFT_670835 [Coprinopsis marcescibilis]|uniref:Uncharacterized protein n=1 Tax=Coprinopsis marcescibilis TaxID=230819 RepID=A0A5C3KRQ1_COPMA|nr:hypothetical protein FA15DRAFT_670835 [Coprinopsis marcescibilis]